MQLRDIPTDLKQRAISSSVKCNQGVPMVQPHRMFAWLCLHLQAEVQTSPSPGKSYLSASLIEVLHHPAVSAPPTRKEAKQLRLVKSFRLINQQLQDVVS